MPLPRPAPRALVTLVTLVPLALSTLPARADDGAAGPVPEVAADAVGPSADAWLRIGLERYDRGNLVGAIEAFEKGYQREARPMFLFALGQAHRKRGDCDRARAMYDAFLATRPPVKQADAAVEQREACEPAPPEPEAEPEEPEAWEFTPEQPTTATRFFARQLASLQATTDNA